MRKHPNLFYEAPKTDHILKGRKKRGKEQEKCIEKHTEGI